MIQGLLYISFKQLEISTYFRAISSSDSSAGTQDMLRALLNSAGGSTCRRGWIRDTGRASRRPHPFRQVKPHLKGRAHADGHPDSSGVCLKGAASSGVGRRLFVVAICLFLVPDHLSLLPSRHFVSGLFGALHALLVPLLVLLWLLCGARALSTHFRTWGNIFA